MPSDRSCCVNCKHFWFSSGSRGYGEFTPGDGEEIGCQKKHWEVFIGETSDEDFRRYMLMSKDCPDFEPVIP